MAGHIGNIAVFQPEAESMPAYLERMDLFLIANDIAADKRVPVFLSLVGGATYGLLRNLCSPANPQDKSYTELTSLLTQHYEPEPLIIAERFHFHRRDQAADESISVYIARQNCAVWQPPANLTKRFWTNLFATVLSVGSKAKQYRDDCYRRKSCH